MTNILTRHGDDPNHGNSGPGGPLGSEIELGLARMASDTRPRYSPELVVLGVIALLSDEGIDLELADAQRRVAALRAGDLLTALGVAPDRPRDSRPSGRANPKEQ